MGEIVELNSNILKEEIFMTDGYDFEFNNEKYIGVEELEVEMDDDGKTHSFIYKRESDGKFFQVNVNRVRYGYEDYCYEDFANDFNMTEVYQKEIIRKIWAVVL